MQLRNKPTINLACDKVVLALNFYINYNIYNQLHAIGVHHDDGVGLYSVRKVIHFKSYYHVRIQRGFIKTCRLLCLLDRSAEPVIPNVGEGAQTLGRDSIHKTKLTKNN